MYNIRIVIIFNKVFLFFAVVLCLLLPSTFVFAESSKPRVVSGILDLRERTFTDILLPQGDWEFRLLSIDGEPVKNPESVYLSVPGTWHELAGVPYAEGEYSLKVLLPEDGPSSVGIMFPELSQVMEVKVDGNNIYSSGDFISGETTYTRFITTVPVGNEFTLNVHLKNTVFRSGGFIYLPAIGTSQDIQSHRESRLWVDAFYVGFLFIVAVYHLFIFVRNHRNRSALYLGLAAFLMMVRGVLINENSITFLIPGFSWSLDYRIEYFTAYMNVAVLLLFSSRTFPFKNPVISILIKVVVPFAVLLSLVSLFLPIHLLSRSIYILNGIILSSLSVCMVIFFHALIGKKRASLLFFIGGMAALILYFVDSFYYYGETLRLLNLSQLGMVLFAFFQTFVLSRLYGDAFLRAETLTHSLENEVVKRTADLEEANLSLHEEIFYRKKIEERLQILSTTDPLTGAGNRLKINGDLDQSNNIFLRYGTSYGVVMFDIDHFKRVNDTYGHEVGDVVLKEIVKITTDVIRDSDILARWGGEEFVILMPLLDITGASRAAERIRVAFEAYNFPIAGRITASFGVVVPLHKKESLKEVLVRMDQNLYQAKAEGRNRVIY